MRSVFIAIFSLLSVVASACDGDPPRNECTPAREGQCLDNAYGGSDCCGTCEYRCCLDGMFATCSFTGECAIAGALDCGDGTCAGPGERCRPDAGPTRPDAGPDGGEDAPDAGSDGGGDSGSPDAAL